MKGIRARLAALLAAVVIAAVGVLSGCSQVIIDWADFLKFDGRSYTGVWAAAVVDSSAVGEQIGEVKFQLTGSKHENSSGYKAKDGDAAFLPAGTRIYALRDFPDRSLVAVSFDAGMNGYKLYREDRAKPLDWQEVQADRVTGVQIYANQNLAVWHGKHVRTLTSGNAAAFVKLMKPEDGEGTGQRGLERGRQYLVVYEMAGGLGVLQRVAFYEGRYYLLYSDQLLPADISRYFE